MEQIQYIQRRIKVRPDQGKPYAVTVMVPEDWDVDEYIETWISDNLQNVYYWEYCH